VIDFFIAILSYRQKDLRFFFPRKQNIAVTAPPWHCRSRSLVFYAVHRENDWRAAINCNVLAGKCKLSAKPRFETMLLVRGRGRGVGRRVGPRARYASYFV